MAASITTLDDQEDPPLCDHLVDLADEPIRVLVAHRMRHGLIDRVGFLG